MAEAKMLKKIAERLLLILFGLLIALSMLEAALWVLKIGGRTRERHPVLGWWGIPGRSTRVATAEYNIIKTNNAFGFRDRDYELQKPANTFRILVLGDSFVEASQVDLDSTFHKRLEVAFNRSALKQRFEVIGMGMSAFGTAQELLAFRTLGVQFQPDLVILAYLGWNDIENNSRELNWMHLRPFFDLSPEGELVQLSFVLPYKDGSLKSLIKSLPMRSVPFLLTLASRSGLRSFFIKKGILNMDRGLPPASVDGVPVDFFVYQKDYSPSWQKAWRLTQALILELRREVANSGAGFMVMILPEPPEVWRSGDRQNLFETYPRMRGMALDFEKPNRMMQAFLASNGISYIDLQKPFVDFSRNESTPLYFRVDGHWNNAGHRLVAKIVQSHLKAALPDIFSAGAAKKR